MSRTYRAELAPFRLEPIHERYIERADRLEKLPAKVRQQTQRYETTCPYCGTADRLTAKVRVGAKKLVEDVPLTEDGYRIPNVRNRTTEILVIHCEGCEAAVDPMAYQSPIVFVRDRRRAQQILED